VLSPWFRSPARGAVLGLCLAALACTRSAKPASENEQHLKALAVCYGRYVNAHRGQTPPSEAELRKFIPSMGPEQLQMLAVDPANLDAVFVSPRDHQPYGVAYKAAGAAAAPPTPGQSGGPMIAWEQTGVGGKRFVADALGRVEEIDDAAFQQRLALVAPRK
jgi:hypothetical protein